MINDLKIIETSDGSHSLESSKYKASYHSLQGAIEESMHVFMSAGIYYKYQQKVKDLKIFEMGFGTGLNAYLACLSSKQFNLKVDYTGIELHPVPPSSYLALNYHQLLKTGNQEAFIKFHTCEWEKKHSFAPFFSFKKLQADLTSYVFESTYDLIFYDAFAPSSQPILWEEDIHVKLYNALNPGGALVTYCAQGKFKRLLKQIGYELQSLNGPSRKHEMTRAVKSGKAS